ncbi:ArsR/SmtB-type metalloregulator TsoR [Desulfurivibrio sp. C05AmB]|uniref:ArsR/SmtB-type metalloregulator TsoR n=1 Tax=Desulfurivibrio sp. C05AmB TaxID=3374371 RepID=UPI00376ED9D4
MVKSGDPGVANATGPLLQDLAVLLKGLADENRLRLLLALVDGEKTVSRLVGDLELSQPLVSHHLKELRRALLIRMERRGPFVFCRLADPRISILLEDLRKLTSDLLARRNQG